MEDRVGKPETMAKDCYNNKNKPKCNRKAGPDASMKPLCCLKEPTARK
jgi:hypothetical protein